MSSDGNENWCECPKCGAPVMIDQATHQAEPCSNCASMESRSAGALGVYALLLMFAGVVMLVYFCVLLLL